MAAQSEADYFAERAKACRAAAAKSRDVFDALANAELAERYDAYSKASRDREASSSSMPAR